MTKSWLEDTYLHTIIQCIQYNWCTPTYIYIFLSHNIFIFTNTLYNSAFIYFEKGFFYKSFYKIMFMGSANLRKRLNNKAPESINKGQF